MTLGRNSRTPNPMRTLNPTRTRTPRRQPGSISFVIFILGVVLLLGACSNSADPAEVAQAVATGDLSHDENAVQQDAPDNTVATAPEFGAVSIVGDGLAPLEASDTALGTIAPTFTAQTFEGSSINIGGDGTARLYGFFAHWCPHCQAELPQVVDWLSSNDLPDGVEIVAISTAQNPNEGNFPASAWFTNEGWPELAVMDSEQFALAEAFGVTAFPFWVAVDADGTVITRVAGGADDATLTALVTSIDPAA